MEKFLAAAGFSWIAAALATGLLIGQPDPLKFEIATIKLAKPEESPGGIKPSPGGRRYEAKKVPVKLIISLMYKIPTQRISGGPGWLDSDLYDVEAKADRSYNIDDLHTMFQNLLVDRFQLRYHMETKEGPVFALVVDKSGSKMKVNDAEQDFEWTLQGERGGGVIGRRESMRHFAWWLSTNVLRNDRPIIDRTGLDRFYDFKLLYAPELPPGVDTSKLPQEILDRPSIFIALREQLGLKLEAQKGPVETFVIDRVERPSEN